MGREPEISKAGLAVDDQNIFGFDVAVNQTRIGNGLGSQKDLVGDGANLLAGEPGSSFSVARQNECERQRFPCRVLGTGHLIAVGKRHDIRQSLLADPHVFDGDKVWGAEGTDRVHIHPQRRQFLGKVAV